MGKYLGAFSAVVLVWNNSWYQNHFTHGRMSKVASKSTRIMCWYWYVCSDGVQIFNYENAIWNDLKNVLVRIWPDIGSESQALCFYHPKRSIEILPHVIVFMITIHVGKECILVNSVIHGLFTLMFNYSTQFPRVTSKMGNTFENSPLSFCLCVAIDVSLDCPLCLCTRIRCTP